MDKLKEVVSKNGLYIKVGALVFAFIGLFLDFAKLSYSSTYLGTYSAAVKYSESKDGKIVLVLILVAAALLLAEKFAKDLYDKIPQSFAPYGPMGLSVVALGITIYDAIDVKSKFGSTSSYLSSNFKLSLELGFWITLIGLIVAVAVMAYDKFVLGKTTTTAAPVQPTTEAPVENNQQ